MDCFYIHHCVSYQMQLIFNPFNASSVKFTTCIYIHVPVYEKLDPVYEKLDPAITGYR